ncbi:MAG: hypothetical protein H7338_25490, partial [Candidatus Sericytochromatia bacterium]|nr:hypothetical protein [Candidatus Sericytochromatia bacterium]
QQRSGSGIDVAAIAYGGIGLYRSLGADFLVQLTGPAIVNTAFSVAIWTPLAMPAGAMLLAGFTGQSVSTGPAVAHVLTWAEAHPQQWIEFASLSRQAVNVCVRGLESGQLPTFQLGMREARRVLRGLGQSIGLTIETPLLAALADSAEALGASGKSSGAGGGDCGIAVIEAGEPEKRLKDRWQQLGIRNVPVTVVPSIGV